MQDALFSTTSVPFDSVAVVSGYIAAVLTVAIGLLNTQPRSCLWVTANIGEVVPSALGWW